MDTNSKYIKMCEQAKEIQTETFRVLMPDDFIALKSDKSVSTLWRQEQNYLTTESDFNRYIWLPRQDQLQDMVSGKTVISQIFTYMGNTIGSMAMHPYHDNDGEVKWSYSKEFLYWNSFETHEQLWLAFVMHEKYNKKWVDDEWQNM